MYSQNALEIRRDYRVIRTWRHWLLFAVLLGVVSLAPKTTPDTQIYLGSDSVHVNLGLESANASLLSSNTLSRHIERPVCKPDSLLDPNGIFGAAAADILCLPNAVTSSSRLLVEDSVFPHSVVARPYSPRAPPYTSEDLI